MGRRRIHDLELTRTVTHQQDENTINIEWYKFEMSVWVEKSGSNYFAEIEELGATCIGGGKNADDAVLDFVKGFIALVETHDQDGTLQEFFHHYFPSVSPEKNRARFDQKSDSLIPPWRVRGKDGLEYAFAA